MAAALAETRDVGAVLRFAVIGDPIGHSRSPAMHNAALRAVGLPHTYEALRVTEDELPSVVQALREGRFAGLNVTVPHKTRVLALVDEVHESARHVGAANTLVRTAEGRIIAHNTDAPALARELEALAKLTFTAGAAGVAVAGVGGARSACVVAPEGAPRPGGAWAGARALVLGSGGAARAAVAALDALGAGAIVVRARSDRAPFELRPGVPLRQPWAPDPASEASTCAIVQATSAGMAGADPGEGVAAAVAWEALAPAAVALDVVYAPAVTPFLEAARHRGLRAAGGLGMLARQGALALEAWLGREAPLDVMLAALKG